MDIKGSDGAWLTGEASPSYSGFEWHMGIMSGRTARLQDTLLKPLNDVLDKLADAMRKILEDRPDDE